MNQYQPGGSAGLNPGASTGRLELSIESPNGGPCATPQWLGTFSNAALTCWTSAQPGLDAAAAANECVDGEALVLFDSNGGYNGVDNLASEPTTWNPQSASGLPLYGPANAPTVNPTATWEVDEYTTEDDVTVYAFVCYPISYTVGKSYPLQIYNHGGFGTKLQGIYYGLMGQLDANGNDNRSDELGFCLNAANNGWIGAASSYRAEGYLVQDDAGSTVTGQVQEFGNGTFEYCLGEVTDTLALLNHFLTSGSWQNSGLPLNIGRHWVPQVAPNEVLMWGWSHGGCVTQRAVQQGAPVNAAATFSAMADDTTYTKWCPGPPMCNKTGWWGMHGPVGDNSPTEAPIAYEWRSPTWFESLTVGAGGLDWESANAATAGHSVGLKARPDVPFLMLQGGHDTHIPTDMACELSANIGSSCSNWYYSLETSPPWVPGSAADPNQAIDPHCGALNPYWQPIVNSSNPGVVTSGWSANWNLVWLDDDDHLKNGNVTGIESDPVSWANFRSFVDHLGWGVEVCTPNWYPNLVTTSQDDMMFP
jgi:hypothetical protein